MVPHANAQVKRCQEILYKNGCTRLDCGSKCLMKHKQGNGVCEQNAAMTDYDCDCFYNC